jgi:hypothetical protein
MEDNADIANGFYKNKKGRQYIAASLRKRF